MKVGIINDKIMLYDPARWDWREPRSPEERVEALTELMIELHEKLKSISVAEVDPDLGAPR